MFLGVFWIVNGVVCSLVYVGMVFLLRSVEPSELVLLQSVLPVGRFLALFRGRSGTM
jgi:hypothetical protein